MTTTIKYSPDEILSFFEQLPPPPNLETFSKIFCAVPHPPLDQSLLRAISANQGPKKQISGKAADFRPKKHNVGVADNVSNSVHKEKEEKSPAEFKPVITDAKKQVQTVDFTPKHISTAHDEVPQQQQQPMFEIPPQVPPMNFMNQPMFNSPMQQPLNPNFPYPAMYQPQFFQPQFTPQYMPPDHQQFPEPANFQNNSQVTKTYISVSSLLKGEQQDQKNEEQKVDSYEENVNDTNIVNQNDEKLENDEPENTTNVEQPPLTIANNEIHEYPKQSFESIINAEQMQAANEDNDASQDTEDEHQNEPEIEPTWTAEELPIVHGNISSVDQIIESEKINQRIEQERQKSEEFNNKEEEKLQTWSNSPKDSQRYVPSMSEILGQESQKKQSTTSPKETQLQKPKKGAKKVVMSYQELQREMNKPAQWGSPNQILNPTSKSINEIIQNESANNNDKKNKLQPVKKGKQKKTVMLLQDFNKSYMQEEDKKNQNDPPEPKRMKMPSMNAIIESEKNIASRPPPTTAPITKRSNHRGRGKEIVDLSTLVSPTKQSSWDKTTSNKPSFRDLQAEELNKSGPPQAKLTPPPQNTSKKNKKPKSQVMTLQEFLRPSPPPQTTQNTQKKITPFSQIEQEQNSQIQKSSANKKKGSKSVPLDEFFKSQQSNIGQAWGASKPTKEPIRRNYDSSDDDDFMYVNKLSYYNKKMPPKFNQKSVIDQIMEEELRKKNEQNPLPRKNKMPATDFNQLYTQESINSSTFNNVSILNENSDIRRYVSNESNTRSRNKKASNSRNQTEDDELFWGAASPDEVYELVDDDDFPSITKGRTNKSGSNYSTTPSRFLAQLIAEAMNDDNDDYDEFAKEISNSSRQQMINSLKTLLPDQSRASSLVDKFFKRFPRK